MVVFGKIGCIRAKVIVFGQCGSFGQSGCIRAKVVVFGHSGFIRVKETIFGQK